MESIISGDKTRRSEPCLVSGSCEINSRSSVLCKFQPRIRRRIYTVWLVRGLYYLVPVHTLARYTILKGFEIAGGWLARKRAGKKRGWNTVGGRFLKGRKIVYVTNKRTEARRLILLWVNLRVSSRNSLDVFARIPAPCFLAVQTWLITSPNRDIRANGKRIKCRKRASRNYSCIKNEKIEEETAHEIT